MLQKLLPGGVLALFALLVVFPAAPVQAAPLQDDEVSIGDDIVLQPGERVTGNLVIFGGDLSMLSGSRVNGDVVCFGGKVEIQGTVQGDLVVLGGDIILGETAVVRGTLVGIGGKLARAPGARTGEIVTGPSFAEGGVWRFRFPGPFGEGPWNLFAVLVGLSSALFLGLLGLVIVALLPVQTANVGRTIVQAPWTSVGIGCLLVPLTLSVAFFALITLCFSLLVPVLIVLLLAAGLFGWVALGTLLGRSLARALGWRTTPALLGGVGVFLLTIIAGIIGWIPCLGSVIVLCAAGLGLGAVALSRFGTRVYRQKTPATNLSPPNN